MNEAIDTPSEAAAEFTSRLDGMGDPKTEAWWEGYMTEVDHVAA